MYTYIHLCIQTYIYADIRYISSDETYNYMGVYNPYTYTIHECIYTDKAYLYTDAYI
jgi:hypothetical protein